jgi:hypothetical protein
MRPGLGGMRPVLSPGECRSALIRCKTLDALKVMQNFLDRSNEAAKKGTEKGKKTLAERKRREKSNERHF